MEKPEKFGPKKASKILAFLVAFIATYIILLMLDGCSPKIIERVETKIEYRDRIVHDTATFEVPVEVEKIVTRDTMSHLENHWAKSDAVVSNGFLRHSLESKPQIVKVPVEVHVTDTLWKESSTAAEYVDVPTELSRWQKLRIGAFWWLFGAVIALLAWTFRKFL